jgi:hypothetical protein
MLHGPPPDVSARRAALLGASLLWASAASILPGAADSAAAAGIQGPDTLRVRIETGAGADFTNELYYQDAFVDTTFLGRRLVTTPEPSYAGLLQVGVVGTRGERRSSFNVQNELSVGDKAQRNVLSLGWRDDVSPDWRLVLSPTLEWRHDRTFDRDQEEWRGSARGRLRRSFSDDATAAELGLVADVIRSSGQGSEFLLDRNSGRVSLALDHLGLWGDEWRVGYGLTTRVFPDSSERDHLEHGWEGRWRHGFEGGHTLTFETTGRRRQTRRIVTTSRDNYWEEAAEVAGDWKVAERWTMRMRLDGEALQYDLEDSTIFFDYEVARGRLAARLEGSGWSLAAGPRAEWLTSRLNPGESYREIAGAVELEMLGSSSLWSVTPDIGWREYDQAPPGSLSASLHSSYWFYQLDAFVDQPLGERLRLRALTALRYESHDDASQDAGSVYLSGQLRWVAR